MTCKWIVLIVVSLINQYMVYLKPVDMDPNYSNTTHASQAPGLVHMIWHPPVGISDKYLENLCLDDDELDRMHRKTRDLRYLMAEISGTEMPAEPIASSLKFDDVIFAEPMLDLLLQSMKSNLHKHRRKRKVINFENNPNAKWPNMTVPYVFNGLFSEYALNVIYQAISNWESETCIRFYELKRDVDKRQDYMIFTNIPNGCYAYYGRIGRPQIVNLGDTCYKFKGNAIHEIGHALGFYHEHSRYDRGNYIRVLTENIKANQQHNFFRYNSLLINTYGVKYDLASVMHYGSRSFSIDKSTKQTIQALDPLYQDTMGQRLALSFFDAQAANLAYCSDVCSSSNPKPQCQRGGYPDPNDCSRCKCPDGFGGNTCQHVAASSNTVCQNSGFVAVTSGATTCIRVGPYQSGTSCNWLLKTYSTCQIEFWFEGAFDIHCGDISSGPTCYHYVEVQYKSVSLTRGPRFCCNRRPSFSSLTSESNQLVVIFRSDTQESGSFQGFKMCYKRASSSCLIGTGTSRIPTTSSPSAARTTHRLTQTAYTTTSWLPWSASSSSAPYTASTTPPRTTTTDRANRDLQPNQQTTRPYSQPYTIISRWWTTTTKPPPKSSYPTQTIRSYSTTPPWTASTYPTSRSYSTTAAWWWWQRATTSWW